MMNNKELIEVTKEIVIAVLSTSTASADYRFELLPRAMQKTFDKLVELNNQNVYDDNNKKDYDIPEPVVI